VGIAQAPSDLAIEAIGSVARSTGIVAKAVVVPVIASGEFKTQMETAKQGPRATRQGAIDRRSIATSPKPTPGSACAEAFLAAGASAAPRHASSGCRIDISTRRADSQKPVTV
jgi:hypothetical protein